MGLKDTAKCMGVLLPFLVRGTWAGMKLSISYQTLTKAKCCWMKVKVLSQHPCSNLCFHTAVPQKSILPEVWPTLPSSVYHLQGLGAPQTLAEDVSLLGHHIPYQEMAPVLWGPPVQPCMAWGVFRGQQVGVRRVCAQTSFQNGGLNLVYIELLEQTLGAALFAKRSSMPQLVFYKCSSLSWPNT